ncbi:MAG: YkgJ family cysteine cluster protein [Alphaproteobacteria bacterium]|nr:YkgJ family cysteine cluster protein [Alphaproteobacteria bacterium]
MPRKLYDCLKCPGYCCSYPVIEVKDRDAVRIARHFGLSLKVAKKKFFKSAKGYKRVMRRKKDEHFGKICRFFDTSERRCTIYDARPRACRAYPGEGRCGYYDFLRFERSGQEDETYISTTWHKDD